MSTIAHTVFLLDVDNTLLDNDRIQDDLRAALRQALGAAACDRYWQIIEDLREEIGYVDYLGSLQRLRETGINDQPLLKLSTFLLEYPFASRVYPGVHETLKHLSQWGPTVILSDGDVVFQPHKIRASGLWDAVGGRVLVYIHKEEMLAQVAQAYPAQHYVMVDDKLRILSAMKAIWGERLSSVFVRQGHYALDVKANAAYTPADHSYERIGELTGYRPQTTSS